MTFHARAPGEAIFRACHGFFMRGGFPEQGRPAGYAALIDAYNLSVPLPLTLSAIEKRHRVFNQDGWRIFSDSPGMSLMPVSKATSPLPLKLRRRLIWPS